MATEVQWPLHPDAARRCRESVGVSQPLYAKALGVTQSTLSRIENSPRSCQVQTVLNYLKGFNLTLAIVPIDDMNAGGSISPNVTDDMRGKINQARLERSTTTLSKKLQSI